MKYTKNYDIKEFGRRIRNIRKKNHMTQEQLAEKLMVSVDSISNYENGRTTCMHDHIIHMSELFNISTDYFFGGEFVKGCSDKNINKIVEMLLLLDNDECEKMCKVLHILYGEKFQELCIK